jgi:hypothetical protein
MSQAEEAPPNSSLKATAGPFSATAEQHLHVGTRSRFIFQGVQAL